MIQATDRLAKSTIWAGTFYCREVELGAGSNHQPVIVFQPAIFEFQAVILSIDINHRRGDKFDPFLFQIRPDRKTDFIPLTPIHGSPGNPQRASVSSNAIHCCWHPVSINGQPAGDQYPPAA